MTKPLNVSDITFRYGSHTILERFSMEVDAGSVLALMGPNGVGKTTLLKLIAGALPLQSGAVSIAGFDTRHAALFARRHQGYVADKPYFYDRVSGQGHIELFSRLYRTPEDVAFQRCEEIGLTSDALKEPVSTYSLGMRTKLSWVLATFYSPDLLLLDEPFSPLDAESRQVTLRWIVAAAQQGQAVVIVSHDESLLAGIASHAGRLTKTHVVPTSIDADARLFREDTTNPDGWSGVNYDVGVTGI